MISLWYILIIAALVLAAVIDVLIKRKITGKLPNVKGPIGFPVIGSSHLVLKFTSRSIFEVAASLHKKHGKIIRAWGFNRLLISALDPKVVEIILSRPTSTVKHHFYGSLTPWLGTGLLTSEKQKWFNRRKIITPTFHFKILEQFVGVFDQQSEILVKQLGRHCDTGSEFDLYEFVSSAALDIIIETTMGTKINAQTDKSNDYIRTVAEITEIMSWRFLKIYLSNETMFSLLCPHLRYRQNQCIKKIHAFTKKIIEERRATLTEAVKSETEVTDDARSKKRMAFLDVLFQSTIDGKPLSNEDIREEVDTFMFEGHDTTTSAICFALWEISRHPVVQRKLYQEICEILGDDREKPIDMKCLHNLKYTECVIRETLRKYPSVPIIARQVTEDLNYGDGIFPVGSEIFICLYHLGNDPDVFPEPKEFRPERHLVNDEDRNVFSLIPFSAGPRNCIGQKFAMLEMKSVITKVLRYYELLALGEDVQPTENLIYRSENGYQLGLTGRTN